MKNYSNLTYVYAGRKYTFTAYMYINKSNNETDGNYLVNDNIILFQYENILNQLYLKGEITYVDKYGVIDRFIELQFVFLQLQNIMHETKVDGDVEVEKLSEVVKFQHLFFVDAIEIRERKGTEITYRISLVSANWLNCISNVQYSNYDREPEEVFDIIKGIISSNELTIHKDTFDAIKSSVKINYATNDNDNIVTVVKYLLHKLYYYTTKIKSMIFVVYNESMNRYQLFDLANLNYVNGTSTIIVSMFKSLTETQFLKYPNQLATITKMPKLQTFLNMFDREVYDYDYRYNNFTDCSIFSAEINQYKNEKPLTTEDLYDKKFKQFNSTLVYKLSGAYWNNDIDIYGEYSKILNEDNSLVITTDADLLRKPGSYVTINVDRDDITYEGGEEDIKKMQDTKNKYKAIEGLWFLGKVRHMISPSLQKYLLNLIMFRNFVKRLK